jgi:carboxypeptidase D
MSAEDQYPAYLDFALEKNIVEKNSETHKHLKAQQDACQAKLSSDPGHVDYSVCEKILNDLLRLTQKSGHGDKACVNMYDVRLRDSYPSCGMNWPPDLEYVTPYLQRLNVAAALNVNSHRNTGWQECNGAVGSSFTARKSQPSVKLLPDILKEVPVMLFSGAEDLICNHLGTESIIKKMEWNGGKGFDAKGVETPRLNWIVEGESAGYWQAARNLTYVLLKDSSHMVPFDYPRRSRDMLERFMGVEFEGLGHVRIDSVVDGEEPQKPGSAPKPHDGAEDKQSEEEKQKELDEAKWAAYSRSGEVALVFVLIAVAVAGFFIWRDRRKRASYLAVRSDEPPALGARFDGMRRKREQGQAGDLEAAAFDESELDDLHAETPTGPGGSKYALGEDSDEEYVDEGRGSTGRHEKSSGPA